ncbi:MAG TPA: DUF4395 domain-containing protein [Puia sp.]|nr:DUF4395 domain-containing protein [Puia sp.]
MSRITVDENRVRMIALFVFFTSLTYVITPNRVVPVLLSADFFLRISGLGRYSPFNIAGGWIVRALPVRARPIDQAPKLFAAKLGFLLAGLLVLSTLCSFFQLSYVLAGILVLFSFLESALGFCAGCHVYTVTRKILSAGALTRPAPADSNNENSPIPR